MRETGGEGEEGGVGWLDEKGEGVRYCVKEERWGWRGWRKGRGEFDIRN